jgi:hypothetical protein
MKRLLILFMVFGLVAGSVATAEAKKKKRTRVERTVRGSYGPFVPQVTGCNSVTGQWACLSIDTRAREAFFSAKVTDIHGQPVFVEVLSNGETVGTFCGETTEPISFSPGDELHFYLGFHWITPLDCPTQRIVTTGTISVTLSNLP